MAFLTDEDHTAPRRRHLFIVVPKGARHVHGPLRTRQLRCEIKSSGFLQLPSSRVLEQITGPRGQIFQGDVRELRPFLLLRALLSGEIAR